MQWQPCPSSHPRQQHLRCCCWCWCCCSVVIKGATDEDAVLCTNDKTFALKLVETTNTLLLLPPQQVCNRPQIGAAVASSPPAHHTKPSYTLCKCCAVQELDEDFAAIPSMPTPGQQPWLQPRGGRGRQKHQAGGGGHHCRSSTTVFVFQAKYSSCSPTHVVTSHQQQLISPVVFGSTIQLHTHLFVCFLASLPSAGRGADASAVRDVGLQTQLQKVGCLQVVPAAWQRTCQACLFSSAAKPPGFHTACECLCCCAFVTPSAAVLALPLPFAECCCQGIPTADCHGHSWVSPGGKAWQQLQRRTPADSAACAACVCYVPLHAQAVAAS